MLHTLPSAAKFPPAVATGVAVRAWQSCYHGYHRLFHYTGSGGSSGGGSGFFPDMTAHNLVLIYSGEERWEFSNADTVGGAAAYPSVAPAGRTAAAPKRGWQVGGGLSQ